ncbi:MAG: guanylate kinase [Actinobacteria bacterium]|nr:guanylate kinase [Actinomycetota bacterium]
MVVVAGPSGVGKSTVVRKAVELAPDVWLSVSATTRAPRPGERNGIDYLFLSSEEFEHLREQGGFLESATFSGNRYGTPRESVASRLAKGVDVLLEIDLQGVRQVRQAMGTASNVSTVFIAPPSWEVLRDRLTSRGTEDDASVARRLAAAREELAAQDEFDSVIINADVEQSARELLAWVSSTGI